MSWIDPHPTKMLDLVSAYRNDAARMAVEGISERDFIVDELDGEWRSSPELRRHYRTFAAFLAARELGAGIALAEAEARAGRPVEKAAAKVEGSA